VETTRRFSVACRRSHQPDVDATRNNGEERAPSVLLAHSNRAVASDRNAILVRKVRDGVQPLLPQSRDGEVGPFDVAEQHPPAARHRME
jgi:hypothetical protein